MSRKSEIVLSAFLRLHVLREIDWLTHTRFRWVALEHCRLCIHQRYYFAFPCNENHYHL